MSETITQFVLLGGLNDKSIKLPLIANPNKTCSTSYAIEDKVKNQIDLLKHLIKNPDDTYYIRAVGDSMIGLGIYNGDILFVDRSLTPKNQDIIIIAINNELICKRLEFINGLPYLIPSHSIYSPTSLEDTDCFIWGVVTHYIHSLYDN